MRPCYVVPSLSQSYGWVVMSGTPDDYPYNSVLKWCFTRWGARSYAKEYANMLLDQYAPEQFGLEDQ